MSEYTAHRFTWLNNGNWNGLLKGPQSGESSFTVARQINNIITVSVSSGQIKAGYVFFKDATAYKIVSVDNEDAPTTITVDPTHYNTPFTPRTKVICTSTKVRIQDQVTLQKTLESVLHQIGGYAYLVQYLAASTVNMRLATGVMPARFFYPNRHKTITGYLSFIAQVLRTYNSFPAVVMGFDGEAHFVPGNVNYNALQLWQWVDKKRAKVISVDKEAHTLCTVPVMQMPCKALMNAEVFGITKHIAGRTFQLAFDLAGVHKKGSIIRFFTPTDSMDLWIEPENITDPETQHSAMPLTQKANALYLSHTYVKPVEAIVSSQHMNFLKVQWASDTLEVGDCFYIEGEKKLYTIESYDGMYMSFYPPMTTPLQQGTKIKVTKSLIDLAAGIRIPAYGEWFLSMLHPSNLTANMAFAITGIDEEYNLQYGAASNTGWFPHDTFGTAYVTNYLYKVEDWCYNDLMMPRTYEHVLELLYEFKRLLTIMWERIQLVNLAILNTNNAWIQNAYDALQTDPYWRLFI